MSDALVMRDVRFSYPTEEGLAGAAVLDGASLAIPEGAFALLTGDTGSGKSTLLHLAKPEVTPAGDLRGDVLAFGRDVRGMTVGESARTIGLVQQSPDAQIVCDTVWHEMAFGLENLGVDPTEMRRRVAETCYFLGMEPWFRAETAGLSNGQRQVLALASTLVMRPRLLLLDEPTSMLDPIAERQFLSLLFRVNRELGVTVVVATHSPAAMVPYATMALRVEGGGVHPVPVGPLGIEEPLLAPDHGAGMRPHRASGANGGDALGLSDVWYRYERDAAWVMRGADVSVAGGEVRALVGGNGSGKSTALSLVAGILRPQRGRARNALRDSQAFLPQNPKALLSGQSVGEELGEWSASVGYGAGEVDAVLSGLGLLRGDAGPGGGGPNGRETLMARNPYDLSGGQQQLVALAKLLLVRPDLLLLDEPTKGLDHAARSAVARAVIAERNAGATVVVVTHDMSFARAVADTVSMLFDGKVTLTEPAGEFFSRSWLWGEGA